MSQWLPKEHGYLVAGGTQRGTPSYVREAIAIRNAGLQVALQTTSDYAIPAEFQAKLDESPALKAAFEALPRPTMGVPTSFFGP